MVVKTDSGPPEITFQNLVEVPHAGSDRLKRWWLEHRARRRLEQLEFVPQDMGPLLGAFQRLPECSGSLAVRDEVDEERL
jgi:hypothetical protein